MVFNLSFVPLVYFLYPETAGRTLEDIDAYYRTSPSLLVFRDKEVTSSKRPAHFLENEQEEVRRSSTANPEAFRRASRVSATRRDSMYGTGRASRMDDEKTVDGGSITHGFKEDA